MMDNEKEYIDNAFKLGAEEEPDKSSITLAIFSYIYKANRFVKIYEIVEYYKIANITVLRHSRSIRQTIKKYKLPYEYVKSKHGIRIIDKNSL